MSETAPEMEPLGPFDWVDDSAFCPACGETMSQSEIDLEKCAACGGDGFGGDDDDFGPEQAQ